MNHETPSHSGPKRLDVRPIPPREKHATIFRIWSELPVGGSFILVNDHDPVPLYYQFSAQFPGAFDWRYIEQGPDLFQVEITRLADTPTIPCVPTTPIQPAHGTADSRGRQTEIVVDARGLEPPEPFMRIVEAVAQLEPGGRLRAMTDRRPIHLFPELEARELEHSCTQQPDGSWVTQVRRP